MHLNLNTQNECPIFGFKFQIYEYLNQTQMRAYTPIFCLFMRKLYAKISPSYDYFINMKIIN